MPRKSASLRLLLALAPVIWPVHAEVVTGATMVAAPASTSAEPDLSGNPAASAPDMTDVPSVRVRPHGAFGPYLSTPPDVGVMLDAASVKASLEARGFTGVSRPVLRGRTYVCEATGPRRERVRLVVDYATGVIVGLTVIGFDSSRD